MMLRNDYGWTDEIPGGSYDRAIGASGWSVAFATAAARIDDATAPVSASSVLQLPYPIGFVDGVGPITAFYNIPGPHVRELYAGFEWKVSNPWQGHPSGVNKIAFFTTGGTEDAIYVALYGAGEPYHMRTTHVNLGTWNNALHPTGWFENNIANPTVTLGVWHRIEVYAKMGTSSTSNNGLFKLWMDGTLLADYSDVNYPHDGFDGWKFAPTWGRHRRLDQDRERFLLDRPCPYEHPLTCVVLSDDAYLSKRKEQSVLRSSRSGSASRC